MATISSQIQDPTAFYRAQHNGFQTEDAERNKPTEDHTATKAGRAATSSSHRKYPTASNREQQHGFQAKDVERKGPLENDIACHRLVSAKLVDWKQKYHEINREYGQLKESNNELRRQLNERSKQSVEDNNEKEDLKNKNNEFADIIVQHTHKMMKLEEKI